MSKRRAPSAPTAHARRKAAKNFRETFNDTSRFEYTVSDAELARALHPPVDNTLVETLHDIRVSDPFRPLENLTTPETTAWIARQNARFEDFIKPVQAAYDSTLAFHEASQPQGMMETMSSRMTTGEYTCWRRLAGEDRWSLYLKDTADYGAPARKILDPLEIDPSGKTNISGVYFNKGAKIMAYTLSVAGSDENTIHFVNMKTGKPMRLKYPATRSWRDGITWEKGGKSFTYIRPKAGLEKSFEVMRHIMGTKPSEDVAVYSPNTKETRVSHFRLKRDMTKESSSHEWVSESGVNYSANRLLVRPAGSDEPFKEIYPYGKGTLSPLAEIDGKVYALSSLGVARKKLVRFDINDPAPDKWETVIEEHATDLLNGVSFWQGKLFASYAHDTADKIRIFDKNGGALGEIPLPPLTTASFGQMLHDKDTCLVSLSGFQEDDAIYTYSATTNTLTPCRPSNRPINLKDCIVERIQATSKDGTKVPMTVIRHPDTKLDGTAATILYGYGGFKVSLEPAFAASIARWVRAGGIYVQSNLRGGGEYGQKWYDQGRRNCKQNVFDDFAACAEHLIAQKYTTPARLAIKGGSNGGLLTLATVLQRPELFGAVVSSVPVADMNRFHIGSYYGYGWKGDYGDPDVKADFNNAAKYSPYHNVRPGFKHPPILIDTDANDDRVLPWHSYKMAALLQAREASGSTTVLSVATSGGHGGGGSLKLSYQSTARVHAFLEKTLGPIDQKAYNATLKAKTAQATSRSRKR